LVTVVQPAVTRAPRRAVRPRDESGFAIVFVALMMTVILAVAAIVIDLGNARQQNREAVAAADAGALAGAQAMTLGVMPAACLPSPNDVNCLAAYHTFASVALSPNASDLSSRTTACALAPVKAGETCYRYTFGGATVEVRQPYAFGADSTQWTKYVHAQVCWNVPTTFARVILTRSVKVCGSATALNTGSNAGGSTPDVTDCITEDNFADASDNPAIYVFQTGDYPNVGGAINFSKGNALPKNNTDIVALFDGHGTDIDLQSIVFSAPTTVSGPSGQSVTLPLVTPNSNSGPEASNAHGIGYVIQSLDASGKVRAYNPALYPTHRFLISYELPDDAHLKVGGLSFVYSASLHADDSDNAGANPPVRCGNANWSFTHDGKNLQSGGGTCGENSFFGFPPEPTSNNVVAGVSTLKTFYVDESPLQTTDYAAWPGTTGGPAIPNLGLDFNYTNVGTGETTRIAQSTNSGVDGGYWFSQSDAAHSKDKYNTTIQWNVPATLSNGNYKIYLKAYDTDNNKPGNDCGVYTWTVTVTGGRSGTINLVE
jgi:Putative Flp pilus-assembly TadE/G-like